MGGRFAKDYQSLFPVIINRLLNLVEYSFVATSPLTAVSLRFPESFLEESGNARPHWLFYPTHGRGERHEREAA